MIGCCDCSGELVLLLYQDAAAYFATICLQGRKGNPSRISDPGDERVSLTWCV
jgi:hypothetical protein